MIDFTTYLISLLVVLLAGGLLGTVAVALVARTRRFDDHEQAAQAYRDLHETAHRLVSPQHRGDLRRAATRIWLTWQPGGPALPDPPLDRAPEYVHRIVDAWACGRLDLSGCVVPGDIQQRIRLVLAGPPAPPSARPPWPVPPAGDGTTPPRPCDG